MNSSNRRNRGRRGRYFTWELTALIAVIALLAGFVLGRKTAGIHISTITAMLSEDETTEEETLSADTETGADTVSDTAGTESETASQTDSSGTDAETGTETQSTAETETGTETQSTEDTEEAASSDTSSELVDAADAEYETSSSAAAEQVTYEAVTEVSSEISIVDVSTIDNVTLYEAVLSDGVASTLYGKTGDAVCQVVIVGDSQFGNFTGTDGMAYLLSQKMHANVYNLAIGGKTASVDPEEEGNADVDTWEETCGVSMVEAICGLADPDEVFDVWEYQRNVFYSCDFSKTDIFIIEFGANDYLSGREMYSQLNPTTYFSYWGALEYMINDLRDTYPDAQILVCTPTYAQFWESGTGAFLGDSYTVSNSYGTLFNYAQTAMNIVGEHTNVTVVNAYQNADIDIYSAPDDLLDGIHLTESGREKYVSLLSRIALRSLGYEIDQGVDPDDVDWLSQDVE